MITKKKVLHMALALSKAGDSDLLKNDDLLIDQELSADDRFAVKEIGRIVNEICKDYSYTQSEKFLSEIVSKSRSFVEMKGKSEAVPARRKDRLDNLYASIRRSVDDSTELLGLVRKEQQHLVRRLDELLGRLLIDKE